MGNYNIADEWKDNFLIKIYDFSTNCILRKIF